MAQKGAGGGGEKGAAAVDDAADIFANLNFDEDDNPESLGVPRLALSNGPGGEGRRIGGAALGPEAGNGAAIETGSSEEQPSDAGAGRQGAKTNTDDNPFSFTKFLQGRCHSLTHDRLID